MKILEHGTYFGAFKVKCPFCGCVFEASEIDRNIWCPECKARIEFDENKTNDATEM